MARVEVCVHIEAPPERVWDVLVDWENQPRWMVDARGVRVVSRHREGVGVVLHCPTNIIAGIVVTDVLVITEWQPQRRIGVRHDGWLIRGSGAFELAATAGGTRFTWREQIDAPLGPLGEVAARTLAVPHVRRVFRRSLAGLRRTCEDRGVRR
ncbi:MAG: SRPBCC family protein [Actinomycetota bacterium]|nr:SRPBCC family protein [Actinomycetota bacterium]MDQ3537545.1 SRPBCC family protein [Actinomycetota bacterium]